MKLIIAGSRDLNLQQYIVVNLMCHLIQGGWNTVEELIHGGCPTGIDKACAEIIQTSVDQNCEFPHKEFIPNWDKYGKAAGPRRNAEMAKYGDALLLIWDGSSRGSANMKQQMEKLGKPVYEVIIKAPKVEEEL